MRAVSIKVYGKVQGVFYRASTLEEANTLELKGWCQNEPDGTVLIHAEGSVEAIASLTDWCSKGPRWANVSNVEIVETEVQHFATFDIRR